MLLHSMKNAGWGVFPVLLCGFISVILAFAFAITLRREVLPLLGAAWVATLLSGCLGFTSGVHAGIGFVLAQPTYDPRLVAETVHEAGYCLDYALVFAIATVLLSGGGGFRMAWRAASTA
jgi:hypothetical protein